MLVGLAKDKTTHFGDPAATRRRAAQQLRAMRAACRKFLEAVDDRDGIVVRYGGHPGHWASWRFGDALGELRAVFGVHIARIAAQNGLDIEDDLARILPASDTENDGNPRRRSARKRKDSCRA